MLPYTGQSFELIGFLDDGVEEGRMVEGVPVLGGLHWLEKNKTPVELIVAIGIPAVKSGIVKSLKKFEHVHFPVLIHERSHIQDLERVRIGQGSIICSGVILTTSITVGEHVLLNLNVTVGHDTIIGDLVSVMPGVNLAGNVHLGGAVMVGSGANIINNIQVGECSTIGAGSVVNHNIPPASTAAGVPARVIK